MNFSFFFLSSEKIDQLKIKSQRLQPRYTYKRKQKINVELSCTQFKNFPSGRMKKKKEKKVTAKLIISEKNYFLVLEYTRVKEITFITFICAATRGKNQFGVKALKILRNAFFFPLNFP